MQESIIVGIKGMKDKAWTLFVDIATVVWLAVFTYGLIVTEQKTKDYCSLIPSSPKKKLSDCK